MLLVSAPQEAPGAKARGARHYASAHPEVTVYTGPQSPRKAVTLRTLRAKYDKGQPITMVTAYDYPSAVHVSSGQRQILVGRGQLPIRNSGAAAVASC